MNAISRRFTAGEIRRFRAGRPTVGSRVAGDVPVLLLHTVGRRSGAARTTPLLFHRDEDGSLLLVAANGGADWDPSWLHNLRARPEVEVTFGPGRGDGGGSDGGPVPMRSVVLEPGTAERDAAWPTAAAAFPTLAPAQRATARPIPLVRLTSN